MHKYLQVKGVRASVEIENEILTDLTSVFLGFGKIMLNGCRTTYVRHEPLTNGTRTITETMTSGYLDRDQFAFAYRLVCAMRRIPLADFMQGLNAESVLAVKQCDSSYGHHYGAGFHRVEATQDIVIGFNCRVVEVQRTMADLNKHVVYIKQSLCNTIDNLFVSGHKTLESLRQRAVAINSNNGPDPALRFLQAIKSDFEVKRLIDEVRSVSKDAEAMLQQARVVGLNLNRNSQRFPAPSPAMFNIVTCPIDGTKLHLPENSPPPGNLWVTDGFSAGIE